MINEKYNLIFLIRNIQQFIIVSYHLIKMNNLNILLKNNWKNFLISIKRRKLILMKILKIKDSK